MKNNQFQKISQRGFTLVEMMVSIALFMTITVMTTGAFLSILLSNKKVRTNRDVMDSVNFAMEEITRNLRTGVGYKCSRVEPSGHSWLGVGTFDSWLGSGSSSSDNCNDGKAIAFFKQGAETGDHRIGYGFKDSDKCIALWDTTSSGKCVTDESIKVEKFDIQVFGSGDATVQPYMLINVSGVASPGTPEEAKFNYQTTVTQRRLDLKI